MPVKLSPRHHGDAQLGDLLKVMRAGVVLVRIHADRVAQLLEDTQDTKGPERAGVLVRAGNLMVDVEDHRALTAPERDRDRREPRMNASCAT
jgi:hypothetical protein